MTRRRQFFWLAAILVAVTLLVPAVAAAGPDSASVTPGSNSALSWTDVRDSDGVPLSNYMFITADPDILSPLRTMLAMVLQLLFAVWLVIVTLAIWLVGFALSFGWLDLFAEVLLGTANLFAGQVATTMVLITAATVGAFFVSYFVVRGFYAKATAQVVTMVLVAVFGVIFLAHPLAEVLGPDGLLAKGRDVGISIAAGLHGQANPDPANAVATMQASLADNFARKPLQVWNFGRVVDDQCGSAWSSGMKVGDSDQVKRALRYCDPAAHDAAEEPSFGQFGAGLVLLICGIILVWFAIRLGIKVIRTALNAVYHGFMSILGFAAGGYIYGPTQTFLIRNLVDTAFAAFGMAAYTVFLAIYVLVLGDVFRQARGQVMPVFVIGAIVMLIATRQMLNLRTSLESGGAWVANRFALATQAADGGGVGGGGATAIGMGAGSASHSMSAATMMAMLTALNTINNNPLVAWGMGKVPLPLNPYARERIAFDLARFPHGENWAKWQQHQAHQRDHSDAAVRNILTRMGWKENDPVSGRMLASLANAWTDNGYDVKDLSASGRTVANVPSDRMNLYLASKGMIVKTRPHDGNPLVGNALAGADIFFNQAYPQDRNDYRPEVVASSFESFGRANRDLLMNTSQPRHQLTPDDWANVQTVRANWHDQGALERATDRQFWNSLNPEARSVLAVETNQRLRDAHRGFRKAVDPSEKFKDKDLAPAFRDPNVFNDQNVKDAFKEIVDARRQLKILHDVPRGQDGRTPFS